MKDTIELMVSEGLSRKEAAERGGVTEQGLTRALKDNPVARRLYTDELRSFVACTRHEMVHVLRKEAMEGSNAAAKVNAARTLLEFAGEAEVSSGRHAVPAPGVVIVIEQRGAPLPAPAPMIEARAVEADEIEPAEGD